MCWVSILDGTLSLYQTSAHNVMTMAQPMTSLSYYTVAQVCQLAANDKFNLQMCAAYTHVSTNECASLGLILGGGELAVARARLCISALSYESAWLARGCVCPTARSGTPCASSRPSSRKRSASWHWRMDARTTPRTGLARSWATCTLTCHASALYVRIDVSFRMDESSLAYGLVVCCHA